jgi:hypothetical protein
MLPQTSVTNYQSMLCNIPEERISYLHRRRSLKSRDVLAVTSTAFSNQPLECSPGCLHSAKGSLLFKGCIGLSLQMFLHLYLFIQKTYISGDVE